MNFSELFALLGFCIAAYSIMANDAIQTLGTFMSSNAKRPWWLLWLYATLILTVITLLGWFTYDGDVSYGRLEKFPRPLIFHWYYILPPLTLLALTRMGIPVSTTFLILSVFEPSQLPPMLEKSLTGYVMAFFMGILIFLLLLKKVEKKFIKHPMKPTPFYWIMAQWLATGFLWSMWLIQDLANIYVYLPRHMTLPQVLITLAAMSGFLAIVFYSWGGAIQTIVTSKSHVTDIRSATIIDFVYGLFLLFFKEFSSLPMSTTWVFIGLLASREIAFSINYKIKKAKEVRKTITSDIIKASIGLGVSIGVALSLPFLKNIPFFF